MENSIEEDIKIVEKLINTMKSDRELFNEKTDKEIYTFFINALEHILSDYKRVLKENEYMHNELNKQQTTINKYAKENEELKNNIRKNENELEFDVNCDWIALQKMLDESEKSNEYISYKNEKWIKEKYCIPIQKIKAKIEELDIAISECIYLDDDDKAYKKAVKKDKLCLLNQKRALQELLEGGQS